MWVSKQIRSQRLGSSLNAKVKVQNFQILEASFQILEAMEYEMENLLQISKLVISQLTIV